jgi:hypothetical protein
LKQFEPESVKTAFSQITYQYAVVEGVLESLPPELYTKIVRSGEPVQTFAASEFFDFHGNSEVSALDVFKTDRMGPEVRLYRL